LSGGLEHHTVACHQGWANLGDGKVDWIIEWGDAQDNSQWYFGGHANLGTVLAWESITGEELALAKEADSFLCGIGEEVGGANGFGVGIISALGDFLDKNVRDWFGVFSHNGCYLVEVLCSLPKRGSGPVFLGFLGGFKDGVDFLAIAGCGETGGRESVRFVEERGKVVLGGLYALIVVHLTYYRSMHVCKNAISP
jgi:hypothetical protein